MKRILLILLLIAATGFPIHADIPVGWSTNYPAALSAAGAAHQPVVVYFTASWCGPCKLMSRITLTDPTVAQAITETEHVGVDIDEHPDIAAKHHVSAVPTFVFMSATEVEAARITGFQAADDFLRWLTNSVAAAKEVVVRQELARKNLAAVDELLASGASNAVTQAATKLFDLCDERDDALVQSAADRLKIIASRDATMLLAGLNDSRLATRIQVANALRFKMGDAFDVDPWSDAATCEKAVSQWREKLRK